MRTRTIDWRLALAKNMLTLATKASASAKRSVERPADAVAAGPWVVIHVPPHVCESVAPWYSPKSQSILVIGMVQPVMKTAGIIAAAMAAAATIAMIFL